jgi:hypothetical protein
VPVFKIVAVCEGGFAFGDPLNRKMFEPEYINLAPDSGAEAGSSTFTRTGASRLPPNQVAPSTPDFSPTVEESAGSNTSVTTTSLPAATFPAAAGDGTKKLAAPVKVTEPGEPPVFRSVILAVGGRGSPTLTTIAGAGTTTEKAAGGLTTLTNRVTGSLGHAGFLTARIATQ